MGIVSYGYVDITYLQATNWSANSTTCQETVSSTQSTAFRTAVKATTWTSIISANSDSDNTAYQRSYEISNITTIKLSHIMPQLNPGNYRISLMFGTRR